MASTYPPRNSIDDDVEPAAAAARGGSNYPIKSLFARTGAGAAGKNSYQRADGIRTTMTRRHVYWVAAIVIIVVVTVVAVGLGVGLTVGQKKNNSYTPPTTIVVCLDGFMASYLSQTPNIKQFFDSAVQTQGLMPAFPAQSFPNQYAMMTGLYPSSNGIVGDYFHSTAYFADQTYSYGRNNTPIVSNGTFYYGNPIWNLIQRNGIVAGTVNWPGSEATIKNMNPQLELSFTKTTPDAFRMTTLINWLKGIDNSGTSLTNPPKLLITHLRSMDVAGVANGPNMTNPLNLGNLTLVDTLFGQLVGNMSAMGISNSVNLIVVSDHGMANVTTPSVVYYEDLFDDINQAIIVQNRPMAYVYPKDGVAIATLTTKLTNTNSPIRICIQGSSNYPFPDTFQPPMDPDRIPPILILPNEGTTLAFRNTSIPTWPNPKGSAGYFNTLPSMMGVFAARGPSFANAPAKLSNVILNTVDIYPLLAKIMGVTPDANNGTLAQLQTAGVLA